jgi:hypothetical protein
LPLASDYDKLHDVVQQENVMAKPMRKDEAHELVNRMPENATWDDLIDEIYVRQVIEQGLSDSIAGKTTDVREVRRRYGLPE